MIGELTHEQIESTLQKEIVGRIGCYADNRIYIVPVNYAYDGEYVYAHSAPGMKIRMMRKNPNVCFEVDTMQNMANWQSVIAWGYYQELHGDDALKGLQFLMSTFMSIITSETAQPPIHSIPKEQKPDIQSSKSIIYRIRLMEKTGRFEKR